jgi:hypothetical protein
METAIPSAKAIAPPTPSSTEAPRRMARMRAFTRGCRKRETRDRADVGDMMDVADDGTRGEGRWLVLDMRMKLLSNMACVA